MKKLINDPDAVTREALEGMEAAHGDRLRVSYDPAFVVRAEYPDLGQVTAQSRHDSQAGERLFLIHQLVEKS